MDTIETEVPAGSDDVTSSPDTTEQADTQTVEPTQTLDGGGEAETGQTDAPLLAGKYKTSQDLEKAYKELEGKLGDLGQKATVADLLQSTYGVTPDQVQELINRQAQEKAQAEYEANPGAYAYQEVQQLKAQLAFQEESAKLDSFIKENPEYQEFRDDIQEFGFLPKYQNMSYEDIAREKFGKAIAQGQQSAYKKIETKKNTQTTSVSQGNTRQKMTLDDMNNMTSEELEAILPRNY